MSFVTNIISCPWHLLTSIWTYSVIFISAESLAEVNEACISLYTEFVVFYTYNNIHKII